MTTLKRLPSTEGITPQRIRPIVLARPIVEINQTASLALTPNSMALCFINRYGTMHPNRFRKLQLESRRKAGDLSRFVSSMVDSTLISGKQRLEEISLDQSLPCCWKSQSVIQDRVASCRRRRGAFLFVYCGI